MASLYTGLNTARSGLMASQTALDVTSQNIANANTTGYSRQTLDIKSIGPNTGGYRYEYTSNQVGNGVDFSGVSQSRNPFLDVRYRNANSEYSDWQGQSDGFSNIEKIFNEFTTSSSDSAVGLSGQMTNLLTALQNYQNTPTDTTLPKTIQTAVYNIAFMLNSDSKSLTTLDTEEKSDLAETITGSTSSGGINAILDNIQSLNKQIASYEIAGHKANDLRDQRNNLLDTLSGELDITVSEQENGMVTVGLANDNTHMLVAADNTVTGLKLNADQTAVEWSDGQPATVKGGSVDAYLQVINGDGSGTGTYGSQGIVYFKQKLNDFAVAFGTLMNNFAKSQISGTTNPAGQDPSLVTYDSSDPAGTISVSDTWNKDVSLFSNNFTGANGTKMGDYIGQLIASLNQTGTVTLNTNKTPSGPVYSGSIAQFADSFTGDISETVSHVSGLASSTESIVSNLDSQRQAISSVSIDEEGINIIKFQQAYSASARVISAINDMLGTLITSMGVS